MNQLVLPAEMDLPPGHASSRLDRLIAEIANRTERRSPWRRPAALTAVAAAVVATLVIGSPLSRGEDQGQVLAYALQVGDEPTYEFAHNSSVSQTPVGDLPDGLTLGGTMTVEAHGRIAYTIGEGHEPGTLTLRATSTGGQTVAEDGVPLAGETADPAAWPVVEVIVDRRGRILEWLGNPNTGIPGFLVQTPLPSLIEQTIMPYAFGPSFPEHALDIGDAWTTDQPAAACPAAECNEGRVIVATHQVVREEFVSNRSTLVIESEYAEPPQPDVEFLGDANKATVWFDPADGIIVKVEWAARKEYQWTPTRDRLATPVSYSSRVLREQAFSATLADNG